MALPGVRCPYCNLGFCLPSDYGLHVKVCPKRPGGELDESAKRSDDGLGLGTAIIAGAVLGSMLGGEGESSHEDDHGSCGGGEFGSGGASDSFGDSGGGGGGGDD